MTYASESHHWYDTAGNPAYTIIGKNGKERKTNLRDARVHNYKPSVTTIMSIVAKPGLENWKRNNLLMSALTLPKIDGESLDDFSKRVIADAAEQAKVARDKGTEIHGALEMFFSDEEVDIKHVEAIWAVNDALYSTFGNQQWKTELSFATDEYGGKVDLHSNEVVVDFKTTEFSEDNLPKGWPEQAQQLAAYANGLGLCKKGFPRCANIYVSTSCPGLVHVKEWTQNELYQGLKQFMATLELWKALKNYDPAEGV